MCAHSNEIARAHLWVAPAGECFSNESFCSCCVRSWFACWIIHTFLAISPSSLGARRTTLLFARGPCQPVKFSCEQNCRKWTFACEAVILMGHENGPRARSKEASQGENIRSFFRLRGVVHIYAPLLRRLLLPAHGEQIECQFAAQTVIQDMKHWETPPQGQFSIPGESSKNAIVSIFNLAVLFQFGIYWQNKMIAVEFNYSSVPQIFISSKFVPDWMTEITASMKIRMTRVMFFWVNKYFLKIQCLKILIGAIISC